MAHPARGNCPREIRLIPGRSGVTTASTLWPAVKGRQSGQGDFWGDWCMAFVFLVLSSGDCRQRCCLGQATENLVHYQQMHSEWTQTTLLSTGLCKLLLKNQRSQGGSFSLETEKQWQGTQSRVLFNGGRGDLPRQMTGERELLWAESRGPRDAG